MVKMWCSPQKPLKKLKQCFAFPNHIFYSTQNTKEEPQGRCHDIVYDHTTKQSQMD
jgi:hypothetical protein